LLRRRQAEAAADQFQVVKQVAVRHDHAARLRRAAGCVLQEGGVAGVARDWLGKGLGVAAAINGDPFQRADAGRLLVELQHPERFAGGERQQRFAVGDDRVESRRRPPRFGIGRRRRQDARVQAAEERRDKVESRREN
jgi:hypothetical protein